MSQNSYCQNVIDSTKVDCPDGYTLLSIPEVFNKEGVILRDTCGSEETLHNVFVPSIETIYKVELSNPSHKKCFRQYSGIQFDERKVLEIKYLNPRNIDDYPSWKFKHCIVYPHMPKKNQIVLAIRYFDYGSGLEIESFPFSNQE